MGLEGWLTTDEREAYGKRLTLKDEEITGPEDPLFGLPPFLYDDRHSSLDWEKAFLKSRTITYRNSSQETALTPGQESSRRWSLDLSWHF